MVRIVKFDFASAFATLVIMSVVIGSIAGVVALLLYNPWIGVGVIIFAGSIIAGFVGDEQ